MGAPTAKAVQHAVAERFGVPLIEMSSHRRGRAVARPRQVAMYLTRELTKLSLPAIGRRFGGRDHTTVMHACRVVEQLAVQDPNFAAVVADLRQRISEPDQPILPQLTQAKIISAQYAKLVA